MTWNKEQESRDEWIKHFLQRRSIKPNPHTPPQTLDTESDGDESLFQHLPKSMPR
jgi:hypothetical protein